MWESRFKELSNRFEKNQEEQKALNEYLKIGHRAYLDLEAEYSQFTDKNHEMIEKLTEKLNQFIEAEELNEQ